MTRRLQLLDPESRSSGRSLPAVAGRVRDGLLRDNKVVPAVLGVLALLIFAWLIAGTVIGGLGGEEEEQQASNQASLAQGEDSDNGDDTETPAPGVDNRDSDASYGGYDEGPKDPFREIFSKDEDANGGGGGSRAESRSGESTTSAARNGQSGSRNGTSANSRTGGNRNGGDDEDFIEQRSPGDSGSRGTPGGGTPGQGGTGPGSAGQAGGGQGGGLFNSGGDLPPP